MQQADQQRRREKGASNAIASIVLPQPEAELLPGIRWGCAGEWFTPAFWKFQSLATQAKNEPTVFNLGRSLKEEIAVCLLGGHGLPAELGLAAFRRIRDRDLLRPNVKQAELEEALREPLSYNGLKRRYRFPRQKAKFLWHALHVVEQIPSTIQPRPLRDQLIAVPGIGPKTASWIVRNHLGSDDVAILDVHILRAGEFMGLFPAAPNLSTRYFELEERFLDFCRAIDEPASLVDAIMWEFMRRIGPTSSLKRANQQYELALSQ